MANILDILVSRFRFRLVWTAASVLWLQACVTLPVTVPVSTLPGWQEDDPAAAWPALQSSCNSSAVRSSPEWAQLCSEVVLIGEVNTETARAFFESRFVARAITTEEGNAEGLITGYYEPILSGSRKRSKRYRFPIYSTPDDLLRVDLSSLFPELANRPVRARLDGNRVVPYYSRRQIENGHRSLRDKVLLWVDNAVDVFFLHIQGSGRVRLDTGDEIAIGYADQNGHPYQSIGAQLIRWGELERENVNMYSIRQWIENNPDRAMQLLHSNPSYIFFDERKAELAGPLGSLNVPLTAGRSIAVDRNVVPLGSPVWLDTTLPASGADPEAVFRRLMMAQDTGGAIKGAVRADVFFGRGESAEFYAGHMKQSGRMYILEPVTAVMARRAESRP
ncbi:MAG: MltA domain-containing protein [Gammaproteobacteria bacterium]|nr:MltA domain-containing protein [Gammaproteobacteria bacterium]